MCRTCYLIYGRICMHLDVNATKLCLSLVQVEQSEFTGAIRLRSWSVQVQWSTCLITVQTVELSMPNTYLLPNQHCIENETSTLFVKRLRPILRLEAISINSNINENLMSRNISKSSSMHLGLTHYQILSEMDFFFAAFASSGVECVDCVEEEMNTRDHS